ncbi:MAG TPA: cysteine--tRNA ligase [Candidatus Acidoferrum sp.]|nr:cysteine--tRNA ligase [Candidatus Acidoferrum sp.]
MRVYNTMSRTLEKFEPTRGNRVNMFVCGPTVYDVSHVGHARTYLAYDIIARYLRAQGFSLFFLMNITDIDDKIINKAKSINRDPLLLAHEFTQDFLEDMKALGITSVSLYAKASEHVPEIISQISTLIERGFAYQVEGDVYFDVSKFSSYGELSHQNVDQLVMHRIDPDPRKKNVIDFALWKSQKPGEPAWDSPWGKGRPGWHIEDTAITTTYLGPSYDIHGGGLDLIFPHHEAEIAQAEAATGTKPLVKYWLHSGLLMVGGTRMGKSMGNYITIKEALHNHDAETLRLYFAMSHYRSLLDYQEPNIKQAEEVLEKIRSVYNQFRSMQTSETAASAETEVQALAYKAKNEFDEAMNDDFNTPRALAAMIAFAKNIEPYGNRKTDQGSIAKVLATFDYFGDVFGILRMETTGRSGTFERVIDLLLALRDDARRRNDWATSDKIRNSLAEVGVAIEDTPAGALWYLSASKSGKNHPDSL